MKTKQEEEKELVATQVSLTLISVSIPSIGLYLNFNDPNLLSKQLEYPFNFQCYQNTPI